MAKQADKDYKLPRLVSAIWLRDGELNRDTIYPYLMSLPVPPGMRDKNTQPSWYSALHNAISGSGKYVDFDKGVYNVTQSGRDWLRRTHPELVPGGVIPPQSFGPAPANAAVRALVHDQNNDNYPVRNVVKTDIAGLNPGDVVRNVGSGLGYVIVRKEKDRAIAIRTMEVSNPDEWIVIARSYRE